MSTLIDTGPLVALINKRDRWHPWASNRIKEIKPPLTTCEAVISESTFLLTRSGIDVRNLFNFFHRGDLQVKPSFIDPNDQKRITEIIHTYQNLPASFADACLVHMAEKAKKGRIFTLDIDFTIYRTFEGDSLSLILPEQ